MTFIYILIGFLVLIGLIIGLLKLWFMYLNHKETIKANEVIMELAKKKTPKLSKIDQFNFIDGKGDWSKIEMLLGETIIPLNVFEYFIDIHPDEYLEHLKKHNPPKSWQNDTYGNVEINELKSGFQIIFFDHGNEIKNKIFNNYDQLLRYLVYSRLTRISNKYKKLINKSYYR